MDSNWRTELALSKQQQEEKREKTLGIQREPPLDTTNYLHNLKVRLARLKKYSPVVAPNNITVNFRTRRNRHRNEDDLDDNLSVISRKSRQSFGRFERLNRRNPLPSSSQHQLFSEPKPKPNSQPLQSQQSLGQRRINQQSTLQHNLEQQSLSQQPPSQQSLSQRPPPQQSLSQPPLPQQRLEQHTLTKEALRRQQFLYTQPSAQSSTQAVSQEPSSPTMDWEKLADDPSPPPTAPSKVSPPAALDNNKGPGSTSINNSNDNTEWQTISNLDEQGKQPQTATTNGEDDSRKKPSVVPKRTKEQQRHYTTEEKGKAKADTTKDISSPPLKSAPGKPSVTFQDLPRPNEQRASSSKSQQAPTLDRTDEAIDGFVYEDDGMDIDYASDHDDLPIVHEPMSFDKPPRHHTNRIDAHANLTRKLMGGKSSVKSKTIQTSTLKSLFLSGLPPGTVLKQNAMSAVEKAAECYLDQMCNDLTAYADHAGDTVVDNKEVELLMLRQRLLKGDTDLEALAYEHLPREYWDQICVSAMGNNYLYPRPR
ncbi:hypothetical protein [Absidia glauca]|uniref:CENP-T/Histone H4 histone fold domain-containing protein n=1 Tax=Absidia glauca TaxID=4829 RepID=A0A168RTE2_ABSGL|nr:hypothetical protein [Absidia glauca]